MGHWSIAQTIVKGVVKDAKSGQVMPFVSVGIRGTTSGTTTDVNGYYELQTTESATKMVFTFLGYISLTKTIVTGQTQTINVAMEEDSKTLDEVIVKPKREKYRNKNNPAVELIREVIDHKNQNRMKHYDYVAYQQYEKMQMAISSTPDALKKNKLLRKYQFVLDNVDTIRFEGKAILPIYIEENLTQNYQRKDPSKKKTILTANKHVTFDERYINNESISKYLKNLYQDVDLYENNVYVVTNSFLSPIADMAPSFYKFYITDTVSYQGIKLVELSFFPRNKTDLLFEGKLYVTLDGHFGVQKAVLGVSKDINLNWVTSLNLTLDFERSNDGTFHSSKKDLLVNFGVFQGKKGLFGERTTSITHFETTPLADSVFKGGSFVNEADASNHSESYWQEHRPDSLSTVEAKTYKNMDSLNHMKSFQRLMWFTTTFVAGYNVNGPVEFGPLSTFYSFNPVEGLRLRFGGRTTPQFSKRYYTESYLAYGFTDQKWKYFLSGTYSINNKTIYDYPLNFFRVSYENDAGIPGQDLKFVAEDNVLLSFKRGVNDKYMYNKVFKLEYVAEFGNHMSFDATFKNWQQNPAGSLTFEQADGSGLFTPNITTSEFGLEWRWAPHEQFFQRKLYRIPIPNTYPIFTVRLNAGVKGILGSEYNYQTLTVRAYKRLYLSQLGLMDVTVGGTYLFGSVPYPLLDIPYANQTYSFRLEAYNMMNFLEFVSDKNVHINIDYHMYGFIFNKIPLFKKLKLREVASLKALYGGLRPENRPADNPSLYRLPVDKNGSPATFTLDKEPYVEASVGVENIFNLIRIDLMKRLTYLDNPNVTKWGIRARLNFDF
jgi:hypothetical protein